MKQKREYAIWGLGIDLVSVRRFRGIRKNQYARWARTFSPVEWTYAFRSTNGAERLAGMFAAKEAAMKASERAGAAGFRKWEVGHRASGAPYFARADLPDKRDALVSISHERDFAAAVVYIV